MIQVKNAERARPRCELQDVAPLVPRGTMFLCRAATQRSWLLRGQSPFPFYSSAHFRAAARRVSQ
jgi:hypothetical protein